MLQKDVLKPVIEKARLHPAIFRNIEVTVRRAVFGPSIKHILGFI